MWVTCFVSLNRRAIIWYLSQGRKVRESRKVKSEFWNYHTRCSLWVNNRENVCESCIAGVLTACKGGTGAGERQRQWPWRVWDAYSLGHGVQCWGLRSLSDALYAAPLYIAAKRVMDRPGNTEQGISDLEFKVRCSWDQYDGVCCTFRFHRDMTPITQLPYCSGRHFSGGQRKGFTLCIWKVCHTNINIYSSF